MSGLGLYVHFRMRRVLLSSRTYFVTGYRFFIFYLFVFSRIVQGPKTSNGKKQSPRRQDPKSHASGVAVGLGKLVLLRRRCRLLRPLLFRGLCEPFRRE